MRKKKLTIDENIILSHNVSIEEFYLALAVIKTKGNLNRTFKHLLDNGYVRKQQDGTYAPTNDIAKNIAQILLDSETEIPKAKIDEIYLEMKELFPKGQKCQGIYWRGNKSDCVTKLKKFFIKYGEYSKDDIINATKRYINSFADKTYMQTLPYFILKDDKSALASVLENEENTEIVEYNNVLTFDGD